MVQTMVSNKFTEKSISQWPLVDWLSQGSTAAATCMATSLCRRWFKCCHQFFGFHDLWAEGRGLNVLICGNQLKLLLYHLYLKVIAKVLKWDIEGHGVMDFNKGSVPAPVIRTGLTSVAVRRMQWQRHCTSMLGRVLQRLIECCGAATSDLVDILLQPGILGGLRNGFSPVFLTQKINAEALEMP